jgi:hypothetical protein
MRADTRLQNMLQVTTRFQSNGGPPLDLSHLAIEALLRLYQGGNKAVVL